MHKNPFVPQPPPYNPPQPPLPPGPPPPPQSSQPDYSAYWAAATAAAVGQPQVQQTYNPQWPSVSAPPAPAPLPPRPPPEQSALYANYGYGGSQNFQWQQQQQQQQQQQHQQQQQQQQRAQQTLFQPPQPQPQPPAMQQYTPYQPQAVTGFVQPYVPQAIPIPQQPAPVVQNLYGQQPQQPGRQYFPQQQRPNRSFSHPQPQQHLHHTPPQHLPPAKRQKFDGPGTHNRGPQPLPPPPQFQPPPPPVSGPVVQQQQQQQPMASGSFSSGRGGGTGGGPMGRGGGPSNRGGNRGRGGSMTNNRGGAGRGRGSNMYSGSRGGSQAGGQLKSHGSRGNFGGNRDYGNRDHGNRRGGSFVGGSHHQGAGGPSFRGRGQGHNYSHFSRGGRHDGGSGSFGSRDGSMASSGFLGSSGNGKKDENRRNFTDFKIVGLEIQDLSWTWGVIPASKSHIKAEPLTVAPSSSKDAISKSTSEPAKEESTDPPTSSIIDSRKDPDATVVKGESVSDSASLPKTPENHADPPETQSTVEMPAPTVIPPPPSRMRIYFHSPVTPDDSRPIPTGTSFSIIGSDETGSRRGKRKKLEDDDGDIEEGRAAPPPPGGSRPERSMSDDRFERASAAPSVEPSVAETASEGDWLMAAIEEDEGDGEDDGGELQLPGDDPISKDGSGYVAESEYGSLEDGVATQVDDSEGVRDLTDETPSLMDGQALDNVHESSPATSLATTQAADVPEAQDPAASLDTGSGSDMTVVGHQAVAPHPEQVDGALSGPFPGAVDANDELAASAPPSEEGAFVISPSSSAPAVPDSSVLASSSSSDTSVAAPPTESVAPDEEPPADHAHSPDVPAPTAPDENTASSASPIERSLTQIDSSVGETRVAGVDDLFQFDPTTQPELHFDGPASSDTSTLISGSTTSTFSEPNRLPMKTESQPVVRTPSANRLSISYAAGTKRLVINAEIVEQLKILRSDGRVEITMRVEKADANELNGILIESLSETTKSYSSLEILSPNLELDPTVPPFTRVNIPSEMTLLVYLDTERPLSEPKWVKSGDVQEWLKSMFGRMFWFSGDAADGWEKKVEVVDPDPAPTIWTVLDSWAANSPVGLQTERQRFVRTHMAETDHILEILLRLVRGERATPFTQAAPAISAPSVAGPLLAALSPSSAHGPQQTHVSLAVLALWRMTEGYAMKALQEKGRVEAEERLGEIIRCLPSHLLYKSLDGIFKEWKVEKKNGR